MGHWRAVSLLCSGALVLALGCGESNDEQDASGSQDGDAGQPDASGNENDGGDGEDGGDGDEDAGPMDAGDDGSVEENDGGGDEDAGAMDGGSDGGDDGGPGADGGSDAGDTLDPQSTACTAFPATVTLGPSIQVDTFGAVLCVDSASDHCRLTTNTYSDGVNPCPYGRTAATFFSGGSNLLSVPTFMNTWEIVSITHGTYDPHSVNFLPTGEAVTAVIKPSDEGPEFTLVFQFNGANSFTLTSFAQN